MVTHSSGPLQLGGAPCSKCLAPVEILSSKSLAEEPDLSSLRLQSLPLLASIGNLKG